MIDSGNGLSSVYCQIITWTKNDTLPVWPFGTNISENCLRHNNFPSRIYLWKCRLQTRGDLVSVSVNITLDKGVKKVQLEISWHINALRLIQNGWLFADENFTCIFLNENVWISLKISLKFFPEVRINNIPSLVQIMAWRRPGDKPLSKPMMVSLLTHICVTRPQCVKELF